MNVWPGGAEGRTPLAALAARLHDIGIPNDGEVAPAAILWTDPGREWSAVLPVLRRDTDREILTLGDYEPTADAGPAIWIRWKLDGADLPERRTPVRHAASGNTGVTDPQRGGSGHRVEGVPVLYLPGVARDDLRAGKRCREELRPLVELLYRGRAWIHQNGKDWTPPAWIGSPDGLDLDLARDGETRSALLRALPELMDQPLRKLRESHLDAAYFHRMRVPDLPGTMLRWMSDPDASRRRLGDRWEDFRALSRTELSFDPVNQTPLEAGRKLLDGGWLPVWKRYAEAPGLHSGIATLLRRSDTGERPFMVPEWRSPRANDRLEAELTEALGHLPTKGRAAALARLEDRHGGRRKWVWARLGQAPLAMALEPLARLATEAKSAIGGSTPKDIARTYRKRGWQADAAAWEAIAAAGPKHEALVAKAVRRLLERWLDDSARAFQKAVRRHPLPGPGDREIVEAEAGGCLFFVDALRYDLGQRLAERLRGANLQVEVDHRWSALPTVTPTAKPTITPLSDGFEGEENKLDKGLAPRYRTIGKPLTAAQLRERLESMGYQILEGAEAPAADRGWAETGDLDHAGHDAPERLPERIPAELDRIADRIRTLLDAGWRSVRVVTDHGFLFLPGGLPKVNLPKHLTATRWARCAVLAGDSDPGVPRFPWHWNPDEWFATPTGTACFNKSDAFAHGGVSVQECLTPDLLVRPQTPPAAIESVGWTRLRCAVAVTSADGLQADLRVGGAGGRSASAVGPKKIRADGTVSLFLDDDYEEDKLTLVLLDGDKVVARRETRAGQNS